MHLLASALAGTVAHSQVVLGMQVSYAGAHVRAGHDKSRRQLNADTGCAGAYLSHMVDEAGLAGAVPQPSQAVLYNCNCHVRGAAAVQNVDTLLGEYVALQADTKDVQRPWSVPRLQLLFGSKATCSLTKVQPYLLLQGNFRRCFFSLMQRHMLLLCCLI
jgi:hypothetical protein